MLLIGPQISALKTLLPEEHVFTILLNLGFDNACEAGVPPERMRKRLVECADSYQVKSACGSGGA